MAYSVKEASDYREDRNAHMQAVRGQCSVPRQTYGTRWGLVADCEDKQVSAVAPLSFMMP